MKKTLATLTALALVLTAPAALATNINNNPTSWDQLLTETLRSVESLSNPTAQLSVSGAGTITATPDIAVINLGVTSQEADIQTAQDKANEVMQNILNALTELSVPSESIQTTQYSVYPVYNYNNDQPTITGYSVSSQVNVTLTNFDLINQVMDAAVQAGANNIGGLSFDVSTREELYHQAMTSAVAQAQAKAATLAQASGKQLGDLLVVSEDNGSYSTIALREVAMDSAAGSTNIQAGQIEITANVTLVYEIQ